MKKTLTALLHSAAPTLGLLAMGAQYWFLAAGADDKGLLLISHPACILTGVILLLAIVAAVVISRKAQAPATEETGLSFVTLLVWLAGFAITAAGLLFGDVPVLGRIAGLLGIVAAGAVAAALVRRSAGHSLFWACAAGSVFLMGYLLGHYQAWSAEPEMIRYLLPLLGLICAMLCLYQMTALTLGSGKYRSFRLWQSLGICFCFAAIPTGEDPVLLAALGLGLIAAGIWFTGAPCASCRESKEETP